MFTSPFVHCLCRKCLKWCLLVSKLICYEQISNLQALLQLPSRTEYTRLPFVGMRASYVHMPVMLCKLPIISCVLPTMPFSCPLYHASCPLYQASCPLCRYSPRSFDTCQKHKLAGLLLGQLGWFKLRPPGDSLTAPPSSYIPQERPQAQHLPYQCPHMHPQKLESVQATAASLHCWHRRMTLMPP